MRALTGGSRPRADKPKRAYSSGSGLGQLSALESGEASSSSSSSNGQASMSYGNSKQVGTSSSASNSSQTGERERWFLPRALQRSSTRDHVTVHDVATADPPRNHIADTRRASFNAQYNMTSRTRNDGGMSPYSRADSGFVVDRERSTTTRETANDPRKAGLWRLNVDGTRERPSSSTLPSQRQAEVPILASPSSSPTLSRQREASRLDGDSSPSPPSPFSHVRSDASPPTTPPDSVLSGRSGFHKRDSSWASSNHSPPNGKVKHSPVDAFSTLPPAATHGTTSNLKDSTPSIKSPSKNDIFSSAQPILAPAPRISTRVERKPSTRETSSSSRQSSFFFSSTTESSPISPAFAPTSTQAKRQASIISVDDRPGYNRTSTEERERERQAIRQNNTEIDFRLCPSKEYLLGEGRHSCVYLGSYRNKSSAKRSRTDYPDSVQDESDTGDWQLCAIKRPFADHQSQLLALEEAFALRRLGPHPNVVRLIKIRDEVGMTGTSPMPRTEQPTWTGLAEHAEHAFTDSPTSAIGKGLPSAMPQGAAHSHHARSASDMTPAQQQSEHSVATRHDHFGSAHRRLVSTPLDRPVIVVAAPDVNGTHAAADPSRVDQQDASREMAGGLDDRDTCSLTSPVKNANETPRLLILLELLPYSLRSFTQRHADQVDLGQWLEWAIELAGVVEWLHNKGCIHADLKPENVLLTGDLHVKVCDFNSALFPNPSTPLTDGLGLGSPHYGAPELTRGPNSGGNSKGFGFAVDIWSLGAILYSMAIGQEPFKRARSMIDILYRKRAFFETEENDRSARLSVAEGSSTAGPGSTHGGSTTVSRHGSLRGRNSLVAPSSPSHSPKAAHRLSLHRRAPSTESVDSVASALGVTTYSGRMPSMRSINMLLDESPPIGVILPPGHAASKGEVSLHRAASDRRSSAHINPSTAAQLYSPSSSDNGHARATSLSKERGMSLLSPDSAQRRLRSGTLGNSDSPYSSPLKADNNALPDATGSPRSKARPLSMHSSNGHGQDVLSPLQKNRNGNMLARPASLLRTASYGDADKVNNASSLGSSNKAAHSTANGASLLAQDSVKLSHEQKKAEEDATQQRKDSELRLAVTAAFTQSQRDTSVDRHDSHVHQPQHQHEQDADAGNLSWNGSQNEHSTSVCWDELQPYPDGYPALLLPGGGRLPDAARDLLKRMLSPNPDLRPTAAQVRSGFEALLV